MEVGVEKPSVWEKVMIVGYTVGSIALGTVVATSGSAMCATGAGVPLGATLIVGGSGTAVGAAGAGAECMHKIVTGKSQSRRCNID